MADIEPGPARLSHLELTLSKIASDAEYQRLYEAQRQVAQYQSMRAAQQAAYSMSNDAARMLGIPWQSYTTTTAGTSTPTSNLTIDVRPAEASTGYRLPAKKSEHENIRWLRQRVDEICWKLAA